MRPRHGHTKWPWGVERAYLRGKDDWGLIITGPDEQQICALFTHHGTHFELFDNDHADARLIAAAPALYEFIAQRAALGEVHAADFLEMIMAPPRTAPPHAQDAATDGRPN